MSTEAAFLSSIRAQPGDDAARLVYADWLQENGEDGRAELIRVQVELSRPLPPQPSSLSYSLVSSPEHIQQVLDFKSATARRAVLEARERELLSLVRLPLPPGWAIGAGLGLSVRAPRGDLFVRRGLGERAVCSGDAWAADGDAILAAHPVERVRLTSLPTARAMLDGWPPNDPHAESPVAVLTRLLRLRFGETITFDVRAAR